MAFCLEVHVVDPGDNTIKVTHCFWGMTEREAQTYKREHLGSCEYFRAAEQGGNTIEDMSEVDEDEMPDPDDFDEFEEEEQAG